MWSIWNKNSNTCSYSILFLFAMPENTYGICSCIFISRMMLCSRLKSEIHTSFGKICWYLRNLPSSVGLQCFYVNQNLGYGSLYVYFWLVSSSLFLSHSHIHTNQRWVTIIAPSLRHTKKNLFHTHTYTNTHLHSAAVCTQIQWLCAREDKNIQYQQFSC